MIKNIDIAKIGRVSRGKGSSHTFSGATINNLDNKVKDNWSNESWGYDSIIIHAGRNDLVIEDPKIVARKRENLIKDILMHTQKKLLSLVCACMA